MLRAAVASLAKGRGLSTALRLMHKLLWCSDAGQGGPARKGALSGDEELRGEGRSSYYKTTTAEEEDPMFMRLSGL
ncbi:hypothetical protein D3C85_1484070 [compost metagenome]